MKYVVILFFLLMCLSGYAQDDDLKFGNTATTNKSPTNKPRHKELKSKRPIHWIKNDPGDLLLGNKCMEDLTTDMGFEYVVQVKGKHGYKSEIERLAHNLTAKIGIMFRNGPFWKFKLKKKRKECREKTGDYVG